MAGIKKQVEVTSLVFEGKLFLSSKWGKCVIFDSKSTPYFNYSVLLNFFINSRYAINKENGSFLEPKSTCLSFLNLFKRFSEIIPTDSY